MDRPWAARRMHAGSLLRPGPPAASLLRPGPHVRTLFARVAATGLVAPAAEKLQQHACAGRERECERTQAVFYAAYRLRSCLCMPPRVRFAVSAV